MRIRSNTKAISTFVMLILLLCSLVFGALLSYLWVMASFYNMPENKTLLLVEEVVFPTADARYFNVTILNPSNSAADANITAIRLTAQKSGETYNITAANPSLPFLLNRGSRQTLKCERNWSPLAGETVRIEPVAADTSSVSPTLSVPETKLLVTPIFDAAKTVQYFNLSVTNSPQSEVNLTISEVLVFGMSIENVTPTLPLAEPLIPGDAKTLKCNWDWKSMGGLSVNVTAKTLEGFEATYTTEQLPGSIFHIENIKFNYSDPTYFNVTFNSSEDSTTTATLNRMNLTLQEETTVQVNNTVPPLGTSYAMIQPNRSTTFKCYWNWSNVRNMSITVSAFTTEGMTIHNKTARTPPDVVWNITDISFDLNELEQFSVKIRNTNSSLQNINVTKVELNEEEANFTVLIPIGEETEIICPINWTDLRGQNATVTVHAHEALSKNLTLPSVSLNIVEAHFDSDDEAKSYNFTVQNNARSLLNATVSNVTVTFQEEGVIYVIYQAEGLNTVVEIGQNKTLRFSWDWTIHENLVVTITIHAEEGFSAAATYIVEA